MGEEKAVYCVCRSGDTSRFMIGCDECEEWYHGDCVDVTRSKSKQIKRFFCPPCRDGNPSLQIQLHHRKPRKTPHSPSFSPTPSSHTASSLKEEEEAEEVEAPPRQCGQCIGCFRSEDCGRCDGCKKKNGCRLRQCVNAGLLKKGEAGGGRKRPLSISSTVSNSLTPSTHNNNNNNSRKKGRPSGNALKMKNVSSGGRRVSASNNRSPIPKTGLAGTRAGTKALHDFMKEAGVISSSDEEGDTSRQCMGPGCVEKGRKNSKYCSDGCGMKLARKRLTEILPKRLEEWHRVPSMADQRQQTQLEDIRHKQELARTRLTQLDSEEHKLSAWLELAKDAKVVSDAEEEDDKEESESEDFNIFCVSCGVEIASKSALKHQMKCFSKYESQASYGSAFKTPNNLYNVFCDAYNKNNHTYCKRLRVICPEHSKDTRAAEECCGYPVKWKDLSSFPDIQDPPKGKKPGKQPSPTANMCRMKRKKCLKHYQWDKLRRALIDQERLNQLLKFDELFEEERGVRVAMGSRGGVLALLLHSTIDHQPESHNGTR